MASVQSGHNVDPVVELHFWRTLLSNLGSTCPTNRVAILRLSHTYFLKEKKNKTEKQFKFDIFIVSLHILNI